MPSTYNAWECNGIEIQDMKYKIQNSNAQLTNTNAVSFAFECTLVTTPEVYKPNNEKSGAG